MTKISCLRFYDFVTHICGVQGSGFNLEAAP